MTLWGPMNLIFESPRHDLGGPGSVWKDFILFWMLQNASLARVYWKFHWQSKSITLPWLQRNWTWIGLCSCNIIHPWAQRKGQFTTRPVHYTSSSDYHNLSRQVDLCQNPKKHHCVFDWSISAASSLFPSLEPIAEMIDALSKMGKRISLHNDEPDDAQPTRTESYRIM